MGVKIIIVMLLLLILGSLFSALLFMYRGQGNRRVVRALTARIALSIALFIFVMLAFYFGLMPGAQFGPNR